jgi:glycosyltransferase involved in cell wall biosynthesis
MNRKIKILNVLTIIEDGGMETLVSRIYNGLNKYEEFEFYLCSLREIENNYLTDFFNSLCLKVFSLNLSNKNLGFRDYLNIFIKSFYLAKWIKRNKIDIVHSHDFFSAFITRISVLISKYFLFYNPKRNFITLHNTLNWLTKTHNIINKILSFNTDKIICVSSSVYEFSKQTDKISDNKYIVIYNGIDTNLFKNYLNQYRNIRLELGFNDEHKLIGNVSTFSIRKGHIYLLESFNKLIKEFPNLRLVLVGSIRDHETHIYNNLISYIDENNLGNYVVILDTRNDIYKIYNILDYYVMPSIVEGFGLALAEAMASELICIGSDIPAFNEIITNNENGFLFKSKDTDSLTQVLYKVLTDTAIDFSKIKYNARRTILEKFSLEKMITNYHEIYKLN